MFWEDSKPQPDLMDTPVPAGPCLLVLTLGPIQLRRMRGHRRGWWHWQEVQEGTGGGRWEQGQGGVGAWQASLHNA